ncbi:MAG: hypothetical protein PHN82_03965 [bacterium]|nr:hypothetical protein [bacterium]
MSAGGGETRFRRLNPVMLGVQEDVRKLKVLARLSLRHATPRKIRNLLTAEAEMLLRRSRLAGLPYFIKVEPTNNCNLRCLLCPQVTGYCHVRSPAPPCTGGSRSRSTRRSWTSCATSSSPPSSTGRASRSSRTTSSG